MRTPTYNGSLVRKTKIPLANPFSKDYKKNNLAIDKHDFKVAMKQINTT